MSKVVIKANDISKVYTIGKSSGGNLRETISNNFNSLFNKRGNKSTQEFWALKNIDFEIKQGDALGIIGKNGAGKSTLLKILSRITKPTSGEISIDGRIASLLEVGTGFHPELTGRENILMNGSILGMKKSEIKRKFDEIVNFSGIERFIDTPVKRYSSGMYVRLAFSVAAHLEPEILILDEVLAVGDTIFQKKCIEKMTNVQKDGKTILFVSHNFSAVKSLCSRGILLEGGENIFDGNIADAINLFFASSSQLSGNTIDLSSLERKGFAHELLFEKISFRNYPIEFGKPIQFQVKLKSISGQKVFKDVDLGVAVLDRNDNTLIHCSNRFINKHFDHISDTDEYLFEIDNILKPNVYYLNLFLRTENTIQDWLRNVIMIEITDGNPYNYNDNNHIYGSILPHFNISRI